MPENPGGLVYGTILVATLLGAESATRETYGETVGAVVLALTVYWLANAYAEFTGERARAGEHFTLDGYVSSLGHEFAVVVGALGPLAAVLICWATGARLDTATAAGVWAAAGIIVATELLIGIRSHLDGRELIVQTAFGVVFGAAVVALRVLLH
jgi:hypothetical protein